jgi:DNA-binding HxlR family transcriptional regulator
MKSTCKEDLRSHCAVNYGVEMFGDRWSLLIIRDIIFFWQEDVWRVPEIGRGNRDQCSCRTPGLF